MATANPTVHYKLHNACYCRKSPSPYTAYELTSNAALVTCGACLNMLRAIRRDLKDAEALLREIQEIEREIPCFREDLDLLFPYGSTGKVNRE